MKKNFYIVTSIFILLNILNVASKFFLFDRTNYEPIYGIKTIIPVLILPWLNFDGLNYLKIIKEGYDLTNIVFFPFYPLLIKALSFNGWINPIYIGLIVNFALTFVSSNLLYILLKEDFSNKVAFRSILIFLLFPTSFYLFAFYTESIFMLISILFFLAVGKDRMILASLLVIAATVTKIFGLALLATLIIKVLMDNKKRYFLPLYLSIASLGLILWGFFNYYKSGDPLSFIFTQETERFSRKLNLLSPVEVLMESTKKVLAGPLPSYDSPYVFPIIVTEVLTVVMVVILLFITFKKIPTLYWVYSFFYVLIIIFSGGFSSSLRYVLVIFPFFLFLAKNTNNFSYRLWLVFSFTLLILFSSLFFRNYWVA